FPEVPPGESHHLNAESLADGHMGDYFPNTNGNPLGPRYLATDGTQLFLGGDFTTVNKVAQQGLARFGPTDTTKPTKPQTPFASSTEPGQVTVIWPAAQDLDDSSLTYYVYRDGGSVPVYTTTVVSKPSIVPTIVFRDAGLVAGSTHTYRVNAEDPGGL